MQNSNLRAIRQVPLWVWVIPLLLLVCWIGARSLNTVPLRGDENNTIRDARGFETEPRTLVEIWNGVAVRNPDHAPGYFMLLNLWARLVGWDPAMLRILSLFAGMLSIAWTYRLGRDWISSGAGLTAAAILSVSAFYAFFVVELRVYILTALLAVITLWVYLRIIDSRRPARRLWPALFGCVALTLYSHYLAIIVLAGIGLYHLLFVPKNRRWWQVVAVVAAGELTFIPWAGVLIKAVSSEAGNADLHERALTTPEAFAGFLWMFSNGIVVLMLGLVAAVMPARGSSRRARHVRQIVMISAGALLALLVINQFMAIMHSGRLRYMVPLWPLFALSVGIGVVALRRRRPVMVAFVVLWIAAGLWATLFVNFNGQLDGATLDYPIHRVARALIGRTEKNDVVLNYMPDTISGIEETELEFYFKTLHHEPVLYTVANKRSTPDGQANLEKRLWQTFSGRRRVWVGYARDNVPSGLADFEAKMVAQGFLRCLSLTDQPPAVVDLYVAPGVSCPANDPSNL